MTPPRYKITIEVDESGSAAINFGGADHLRLAAIGALAVASNTMSRVNEGAKKDCGREKTEYNTGRKSKTEAIFALLDTRAEIEKHLKTINELPDNSTFDFDNAPWINQPL